MTGSAYAADKMLAHLPIIEEFRAGRQPNPLHVQFIISDLCNQDCGFCAYRMSGYTSNQLFGVVDETTGHVNNNPNRTVPYEKALEILQDCHDMGVRAIQYTGGGEPTVHAQHLKIFQHTLDLDLEMSLVTNGVRLT